MAEVHYEKGHHGLGIFFVLMSELAYALMQVSVALTDRNIGVAEQTFSRSVISFVIFYLMSRRENVPLFGPARYRPLLLLRAALGICSVTCLFYAVRNAHQADVALMSRMSIFMTTALSAFFLKERIGAGHVFALLLAFTGAFIAADPRFDSSFLPMFAAFCNAFGSSIIYILLAYFAGRVHATTILLSFCLLMAAATFPPMMASFVMPTPRDAFFMLCTGLSAAAAQVLMTRAYRMAPPGELGIYSQLSILMSAVLGWLFLSEVPSARTCVGGAVVIVASFVLYFYKNRQAAERRSAR